VKRKFLYLSFILILCSSCAVNRQHKADKELFDTIYSEESDSVVSFKKNENIYIKHKIDNSEIFLQGNIAEVLEREVDNTIYTNKIIHLNISETPFDKSVYKNNQKIKYIQNVDWVQIIKSVFEEMIPQKENAGILASIQAQEMVLYRDKNNDIEMIELSKKPKNVNITKTYAPKDYEAKFLQKIERKMGDISKNGNYLFLLETRNKNGEPPYVLINTKKETIYSFQVEGVYEKKEGHTNIGKTARVLGNITIKSHFIEPLKSPYTSSRKLITSVTHFVKKFVSNSTAWDQKHIPELAKTKGMDLKEFDKILDDKVGKKKHKASLEFLIGGESFFPNLIQDIENSKKSIDFRVYIFEKDDYALKIADLLKNKSNETDVKVKVLFDSLANLFGGASGSETPINASYKTPSTINKYLKKDSKIKVRSSANPFGKFDHVKTLIFDEKIAYLGGMNIGKEYRYAWHDMMIKVEGPATKEMHNEFEKAWFGAGPYGDFGKLGIALDHRQPQNLVNLADYDNLDKMINIRILYTKAGVREILKAKLVAIKNAKKYIYIENPYLSDIKIVRELIRARQRGVDVRVIFPGKNNIGLMSKSNIVIANKLLRNGVRVFIYPGMTHIKAGIFDDWATVGSANYNNISLVLSQEMNIAFDDKKTIEILKKQLFESDFAVSEELTEEIPATWTDRASKRIANYF